MRSEQTGVSTLLQNVSLIEDAPRRTPNCHLRASLVMILRRIAVGWGLFSVLVFYSSYPC
jgi:hypothetical protein